MESVKAIQTKPLKVKILGTLLLLISFILFFIGDSEFSQLFILFFLGLLVLGYSIVFEVNKDFNNVKHFCLFTFSVFRIKLVFDFPEYISVFATDLSASNEWGTVSSLGTKERYSMILVRFFCGSNKFTFYKSNNYDSALSKAKELEKLLNVEIYDATKN